MIDFAMTVSRPRQPGSIFTHIGWSLAALIVLLLAAVLAEPLLVQRVEKNTIEIGGADLRAGEVGAPRSSAIRCLAQMARSARRTGGPAQAATWSSRQPRSSSPRS